MQLLFRQAKENDFRETENLTREAFWDVYKPGCDEHLVLHNLRKSKCYIPELDIVEVEGDKIIGHIICTKAKVADTSNTTHTVLCAGPFAMINHYQKKGYGSMLMEYCIIKAKEAGYPGIILFGNPEYYHRFGFRNAVEFGITTKDGMNFEPFMGRELIRDGLKGINGRFYEDESFYSDPDELAEFEKQFPYKEKHVTPTQLNM